MAGFNVVKNAPAGGSGESNIDHNSLNVHTVEASGGGKTRNVVGIVSSILDLGVQELDDAKVLYVGDEAQEAKDIAAKPNTYFETDPEDNKRYKRWPQVPQQSVALTVDFPQIIVDKGQFFGESQPLPLRMLLNGEWLFDKKDGSGKEMCVNRPYDLKETTKALGVWSLSPKSVLYRMAANNDLLNDDKSFHPAQIDQLLGKAFQFEIKLDLYVKGEKKYLNEHIKFLGSPAEGVPIPEIDDSLLSIVQFTEENTPESIKVLRASVKNTMRRASNFEGSTLQGQLGDAPKAISQPKAEVKAPTKIVEEKEPVKQAEVPTDTEVPELDDNGEELLF